MEPLRVHKIADKSSGTRVKRFNTDTGEPYLLNPLTGQAESWPFLGLEVVDSTGAKTDPPETTSVPTKWVVRGVAEGWLELLGTSLVHRPGGPPEDPFRITHTFTHADRLVMKTTEGAPDIVYEVTRQPDKFVVAEREQDGYLKGATVEHIDAEEPVTPEIYAAGDTAVLHTYDLKLVSS